MAGFPRLAGALLLLASAGAAQSTVAPDFSVAFIERLPKIDYVWGSESPDIEGWPLVGSEVAWVAHVRNNGASAARVPYRWLVDGAVAGEGAVDLPPQTYTQVSFPWTWTFARHAIAFEIDPDDAFPESQERNNLLRVDSDALAVAFYVERSYWNATFAALQQFDVGAATLDDWLQRRIRNFNEMAALARWPETPDGVADRLRIDAIHVVDDGALPLSPPPEVALEYPEGSHPIRFPNAADRSVDIQWGFPATGFPIPQRPSDLHNESLLHELGHARYLVDVYGWGIAARRNDRVMLEPAPPLHSGGQSYFDTLHWGLMNEHWGFFDRYSAAAMNLIAGHRATRGNYNPPENLGAFLNDLPERSRVRLVLPDGTPAANAPVRIYRSSAEFFAAGLYPKTYDGVADLERTSDADGWIDLPGNPFSDGAVVHGGEKGFGPGSNVTAIVRVERPGGSFAWGFLESIDFNLAFWRGERDLFEHELLVGGPFCSAARRPTPTYPGPENRVTQRNVQFIWAASTEPARVELWIAVDGGEARLAAQYAPGRKNVEVPVPPGRIAWWVEATYDDGCPPARSSIYFFDHDVPPARRRVVARP